jgi:hypothetical protein
VHHGRLAPASAANFFLERKCQPGFTTCEPEFVGSIALIRVAKASKHGFLLQDQLQQEKAASTQVETAEKTDTNATLQQMQHNEVNMQEGEKPSTSMWEKIYHLGGWYSRRWKSAEPH